MAKLLNEDQIAARLESALYSAGRPLTIEELIKAAGTESRQKTLAMLESIIKKMKNTFKAIEIVTLPDGSYVFQLKPEYSASVRKYASKPLLSRATQKNIIIYCTGTTYKFKTTLGSQRIWCLWTTKRITPT